MGKPPPPPRSERRAHERYDLLAQVELEGGGEVAVLQVANISAGGIRLQIGRREPMPTRVGQAVQLYLDLGDDADGAVALRARAEVVRVDLGGPDRDPSIALMWTSSDPDTSRQLTRVLEHVRARAGQE